MPVTVEVFDPSMCCPTGVCGPSVDPVLPRFAADLDWLKENGVHVVRYNLAQEPGAFAAAPAVQAALKERGTDCLPLIVVDGGIVSQGCYPARGDLARWTRLDDGSDLICTTTHCSETRADLMGDTSAAGDAATGSDAAKSSCCGSSAATDASTASEPTPAKSRCCG